MKTYCISDIHGHLDNLNRFKQTLEKDDRVFVLGDVIDKGPDSIKCLELVMNDSRFKMLLGNHEYMMFNLLSLEEGSFEYKEAYKQWITWNSGKETLEEYKSLEKYKQVRIYNLIKSLPLNYPNLKVGEKTYYLVHSKPHANIQLKMEDVSYDDNLISSYVWDRVSSIYNLEIEDQIIIAGHSVVQATLGEEIPEIRPVLDNLQNSHLNINEAHYINIDGGLAYNFDNSRLIALCLDDLSYKLY